MSEETTAKEPRKATDVLLALEQKIEALIGMVRNLEFTIKIVSNKLNELTENAGQDKKPSKVTVEAVNTGHSQNKIPAIPTEPERKVLVNPETTIQEEKSPKGFRRTSRPETFAGDDVYLPKKEKEPKKAEVMVPSHATNKKESPTQANVQTTNPVVHNSIPVSQRIVNGSGKSVFLADVEIINKQNGQTVSKNRTNGAGKWTAPLPIGGYRVIIKKHDPLTKEKIEVSEDIMVDGASSPLELNVMIIK